MYKYIYIIWEAEQLFLFEAITIYYSDGENLFGGHQFDPAACEVSIDQILSSIPF